MSYKAQSKEIKRYIRSVAKKHNTTNEEMWKIWRAIWLTAYSHMSTGDKPATIRIKWFGKYRLRKDLDRAIGNIDKGIGLTEEEIGVLNGII